MTSTPKPSSSSRPLLPWAADAAQRLLQAVDELLLLLLEFLHAPALRLLDGAVDFPAELREATLARRQLGVERARLTGVVQSTYSTGCRPYW